MIEFEKQLSCSQNHNQPIQMVVLDKKLKRQEHLLCNICMETFNSDSKIIEFKKVIKLLEDNQNNTRNNVQNVIQVNVDLIEQFQNEIYKIYQSFIKQFNEMISNFVDWIKSLIEIGKGNSQYSFYDELELLISNTSKQEQLIDQIKVLNNSFFSKINLILSNLKSLDLYSQCEKYFQNWNLSHQIKMTDISIKLADPIYSIKLIDNSIKQTIECYAISFNSSGSLMISASNQDIKVWNFAQGILKEITTLKEHTNTIFCLQFSQKSNSFVSVDNVNSIRCWKQINEKEWKSSNQKQTNQIYCLILNQSENELVSGGKEYSIKIWQIDFKKNKLSYLYSLDKHTNYVSGLSFNKSENILVSCGYDNQIIIWKKDNKQKWLFDYVVIVFVLMIYRQFNLKYRNTNFIKIHFFIIQQRKNEIIINNLFKFQDVDCVLQMIINLFGQQEIKQARIVSVCLNQKMEHIKKIQIKKLNQLKMIRLGI